MQGSYPKVGRRRSKQPISQCGLASGAIDVGPRQKPPRFAVSSHASIRLGSARTFICVTSLWPIQRAELHWSSARTVRSARRLLHSKGDNDRELLRIPSTERSRLACVCSGTGSARIKNQRLERPVACGITPVPRFRDCTWRHHRSTAGLPTPSLAAIYRLGVQRTPIETPHAPVLLQANWQPYVSTLGAEEHTIAGRSALSSGRTAGRRRARLPVAR